MNIKIEPEVLVELKETMKKEEKPAARFVIAGFGCNGPVFDISFDDIKDNDIVEEYEGIKFIFEKDFAIALKAPEIVKAGNGFEVKRTVCGC